MPASNMDNKVYKFVMIFAFVTSITPGPNNYLLFRMVEIMDLRIPLN